MKKLSVLLALLTTLSACHSSGDAIKQNKEAFVLEINQFYKTHMENFLDCARYYAKPEVLRKTGMFKVFSESGFAKQCDQTMEKILIDLNKNALFSNVTLADLKDKTTWEIYFASNNRKAKLENDQDDFLK